MKALRDIFKGLSGVLNVYTVALLTVALLPFLVRYGGFFPWCDTTAQYIPFIMQCKRMLASGMPLWDWNTYLGDNYLGAYAYYTYTRPHVWLMCLLPYEWIPRGFVLYIYLEYLTIACLAWRYLGLMGYGRRLRLVGSVLFTFSGYMVSAFEYSMFYDPIWAFVLLLICVERYLRGMRHGATALVVSVFVVAVVNYYFMVSSLIAVAIYFVCRLMSLPRGGRVAMTAKAAGYVCLGLMMSAVVLVPVMMYLSGTHREGIDLTVSLANICERLRGLFMPPVYDGPVPIYTTDSGWYMNSANVTVFGLMFSAMYVMRNPRSWMSALTLVYMVCYLTPVNGVFCLFTEHNYTRWVYALNLAMILTTLGWLRQHEGAKVPWRQTVIYVAVCMAVYALTVGVTVYLRRQATYDAEAFNLLLISVVFFVSITALAWVNRLPILSRRWVALTLGSVAVVTVMQVGCFTLNRSGMGPYPLFDEINLDRWLIDNEFDGRRPMQYRYEYLPQDTWIDFQHNSAAVNQRPSTQYYLSLRNNGYRRLFDLTSRANSPVAYNPDYSRAAFDALMSVRRVEGTDHTATAMADYPRGALIATDEPNVYDYAYYIPMGMAYDSYVIDDDKYLDDEFKQDHDVVKAMLNSLFINAEDEAELSPYMRRADFDDTPSLESLAERRRHHTADTFVGDTHGFTSTITLADTMVVFYSVVADRGFTATIDGEPAKIYEANLGLSAVIVPAGTHTIRFEYMTPGLIIGALISLVALVLLVVIQAPRRLKTPYRAQG